VAKTQRGVLGVLGVQVSPKTKTAKRVMGVSKQKDILMELLVREAHLEESTTGAPENLQTLKRLTPKTPKTIPEVSGSAQTRAPKTPKTTSGYKNEAAERGLVATWAATFGYVSIHDPVTGEWHDMKTADAPDWAKAEAFKRKDLYRSGDRRAYRLTAREMEEIWEAEHPMPEEGIVEEIPIEDEEEEF
jgi:hypothetical protein